MGTKDRGGRSSKKPAAKTLKEKRAAKKTRKTTNSSRSVGETLGHRQGGSS
jgi:hypothetical protein